MDQEQITIELDDRPAKAAVDRVNAGLDSIEKKTTSVVDGMGKQWELQARTVINVVDRSKNAVDRYLTSLEKQAAAYGKTNEIERLIALRDTSISKYKDEKRAIDGITESYGKMINAAQQSAIAGYERQAALYHRTGTERLEAQRDIELRQYASPEQEPVRQAIRQSYGQMIDEDKRREETAVIEKQKASLDQLMTSLERENALMGKSGIQRQITERQMLLKEWQHEPAAVNAITESIRRLEDEEKRLSQAHGNTRRLILGAKDFMEGYSRGAIIEGVDYLMSLRGGEGGGNAGGIMKAASSIGSIVGISGTATIALGSLALAFGGLEIAGLSAMKSLAKTGEEIENIHLRTGLAVSEVQDFAYAAKATGQSVDVYERMMRGLAQAADDNSREGEKARNTLKALGVDLRNDAGELKPTSEVLKEVAAGLNKLPEGFQRDAAAMDLFKKSGIDAVPVITHLLDNLNRAKNLGPTLNEGDKKLFEQYRQELADAEERWSRFSIRIKEPLAATVAVTFKWVGKAGDVLDVFKLATQNLTGLNLTGGPEAPKEAQKNDPDYARRVRERQQTDAQIRAFISSQEKDVNYQLRQAEDALGKLPKPEVKVTTPTELATYKSAFNRVEQLKAQVKAVQQLREEETKLQEFEKRMTERDGSYMHIPVDAKGQYLPVPKGRTSNAYFDQNPTAKNAISIFAPASPVDKIFAERDDLVKHGADMGRATAAALAGASAAIAKEEHDWQQTWTESVRKGNEEIDKLRDDEAKKAEKSADDYTKAWLANLQRNMAQVKEIDERNLSRMGAAEAHQERMISLSAGPGDELKALHEQLALREKVRQAELQMKELHAGMWDLDKERFSAEMDSLRDRYEFEEKILELKKQQSEEVKSAVEPLVHTLFTKPGDFGQQISSTLRTVATRPLEEGISTLVSRSVTPLFFGADGRSGLHGMLQGTLGNANSDQSLLKGTVDLNNTVTAANTAAVQSQTAMWHQQMEFQRAMMQNALHGGEVGWAPSIAPQLQRESIPGSGVSPLDVLRLQNAGTPAGIVTSTIRYAEQQGGSTAAPSAPTLQSLPALPRLVLPNLSSNLVSPRGFATLGDVASLGIPSGIFAPATNAYQDRSVPLVTGADAVASPAPTMSPSLPYMAQQPAIWDNLAKHLLGNSLPNPDSILKVATAPGSGGLSGALHGSWTQLKGVLGQNVPTGVDSNGNVWATFGSHSQQISGGFAGVMEKGLASPAAAIGGGELMLNGLTGSRRGTWGGIGEDTAGGALLGGSLGMMLGGPMGAALGAGIGAAAGFVAGGVEKLAGVETPENEAKRLTKQIYGVSIDTNTAHQIVSIAAQKYAAHVSVAERSPEVRQLVLLYSEATGQKMPLSATTPRGGSLVEQGGKLYQAPTYQDGQAYTFQSNLPVAGGYSTGTYAGPSSVQIVLPDGQSVNDLLDGRVANMVTPSYVQDQFSQASNASYGRLSNSAMLQQPGLLTS